MRGASQTDAGTAMRSNPLPPLCVELEHCLIKANPPLEDPLAAAHRLKTWLNFPARLWAGHSGVTEPAKQVVSDPRLIPYNQRLVAHLAAQRNRGRYIVLLARCHRPLAEAIAGHLGCFDAVIVSDPNDKASARLDAIRTHLGSAHFSYAGNRFSDMAMWRAATQGIVVNSSANTVSTVQGVTEVAAVIDDRAPLPKSMIRAFRPHQWVKNLLLFVPLVASGAMFDWKGWAGAMLAFAGFCATASAIYIVNDLTDLAADRAHPRKRTRPFASGAIPVSVGLTAATSLLSIGVLLSAFAGVVLFITIYAAASLVYSLHLKRRPLIDVFCLSLLYIVRMLAGGEASGHRVSLWLLGFAFFLFLGLALMKRVAELSEIEADKHVLRRGYYAGDTLMLALMGVASAFTSSAVLALYLQSAAEAIYASPSLLLPLVPLLLFWQCRLWLSTHRGYMHDDPIVYSARDWVSWLVAGVAAVLVALAHQPGLVIL